MVSFEGAPTQPVLIAMKALALGQDETLHKGLLLEKEMVSRLKLSKSASNSGCVGGQSCPILLFLQSQKY